MSAHFLHVVTMSSSKNNSESADKKTPWYKKLRDKYRLIILNEDTFEEKLSFRLSRLNVFVVIGMLAIIFIFLTTYIIAFTPLKEYIPGYSSTGVQEELYELQLKADSLEKAFKSKDIFINNMRKIMEGDTEQSVEAPPPNDTFSYKKYENIKIKRSKADSLLRIEYEKSNKYALMPENTEASQHPVSIIDKFFPPVKGLITNKFNAQSKHYGVDIVAPKNEAIKAAYDGTVIFSEWSSSTGHVIALQHINNVITVYKHNSVILKKQGSIVKAGESIAIIGESGELSTGPHLHFELWIGGKPVDPEKYIIL